MLNKGLFNCSINFTKIVAPSDNVKLTMKDTSNQNSKTYVNGTTSNGNYNGIQTNGTNGINGNYYINDSSSSSSLSSSSNSGSKNGQQQSSRPINLKGYVGFDRLADQFVKRSVKEGFAFNILCIGETGIGKSTLIDTLFNTQFKLEPSDHHNETVRLKSNQFLIEEQGITLKLNIIETSGYGDQINKEKSHEPITAYVDAQFEAYLQEELGLNRHFRQANDTRIHVCLYFLTPTGHSLKALDISTMKALDHKCNIIPIVAKADTIGKCELAEFKKRIMAALFDNGVEIYRFPVSENDLNVNNLNSIVNNLFPLAVVGSSDLVKVGTKLIRGRQYEWGVVAVENESHCDFVKLREMLLSTNMLDLVELTHVKHYSLYRAGRLREMGFCCDDEVNGNSTDENGYTTGGSVVTIKNGSIGKMQTIQDVYNLKRAELIEDIQRKEMDIKEEFMRRVKLKEAEIKDKEKELSNKFSHWKKEHNAWSERLDHKRRDLEEQIREFSERKFTLEKSKLSTLTSINGKFNKKK